jgi:hypothetical protein
MKIQQTNETKQVQFTIGRTFKNKQQLRDWILKGESIHNPQLNGKLYVLKGVFDTTPEDNDPVPFDQRTRTAIEHQLTQTEVTQQ